MKIQMNFESKKLIRLETIREIDKRKVKWTKYSFKRQSKAPGKTDKKYLIITPVFSLFFSLIAIISAVWTYALLVVPFIWGCQRILLQNVLSFLFSLIHLCRLPCYYYVSFCVVGSATFSRSHSLCVYHLHSRIIWYLPTTGIVVSGSSLLSPSVLPYIFVPVFLGTLL